MFIVLFVELLWLTLNMGYDIHYLIQNSVYLYNNIIIKVANRNYRKRHQPYPLHFKKTLCHNKFLNTQMYCHQYN